MSALSGATVGIVGLTGLYGFIFYFITALMLSVMLSWQSMIEKGSFVDKP